MKKQNGFAPLVIVLVIAVVGLIGYFVYKNYFVKTAIKMEATPNTSAIYKFDWNEAAKIATVSKGSSKIVSFNLAEKPLDVYFYIPKNILAIVTKDNNLIQHLYIYKNSSLTKVFSGKKVTYTDALKDNPTSIFTNGFSPDAKYLLASEGGFEWVEGHVFSINDLKEIKVEIKNKPYLYSAVFWHPQSVCFTSIGSGGMWSPNFDLFEINNGSIKVHEVTTNGDVFNSLVAKTVIWWNNDCSGVVRFENSNDSSQTFYKFSAKSATLDSVNQNNSAIPTESTYQEHIYKTN